MITFRVAFLFTLAAIPAFALAQYEFTPLTNLPGLNTVASSDTLPTFLSNLYRLCIGAAAVIAVLQIMRAGVQYFMFNKGSVAHNEKGKALIGNALLGLLLVLSPAIVFGIINPDILNLNLDVTQLKLPDRTHNLTQTGIQVEGVIDGALQYCDMNVTQEERSCISGRVVTIFSTASQCIVQGNPNACFDQARQSARTAARTCVPTITNTQESCLDQKLVADFRSGNTSGTPSCQTFVAGDTPTATPAAQQCCAVQNGCQLRQNASGSFCHCQSATPHTPSIDYAIEESNYDGPGTCTRYGNQTYATAQQCTDSIPGFLRGGGRRAFKNNCTQEGQAYEPYSVYSDLTRLPECDQ